MSEERVLGEGRFLRLLKRNGWELVERTDAHDVVVIVAVTPARELLLVEQWREPVRSRVVELPAGLAGDEEVGREVLEEAASRELLEETGYRAGSWERLAQGPPSAGLGSEIVTFLRARAIRQVGEGGGVGAEEIEVHRVALEELPGWLEIRAAEGRLIDPKVWAGLWFARSGTGSRP
ncbi:MAG: NUDIX hydrolase [Thermoanaerobaculia bacterium]|nr:NUDIX hydrolase [Thermoanaerobaculia bacterium]